MTFFFHFILKQKQKNPISGDESENMNLPENCSRSKKGDVFLAFSSSSSADDIVEEREELMVCKNPYLNFINGSEAMNLCKNRSVSSPPSSKKALTESVCFNGWRHASVNFMSWAGKMSALHEATWRKAGIFEAVKASTTKIHKDTDLVLGIAEKWCPDTNTFVFPWGETTITLEDVMVLLGFSVLGLPVFASLESSEKKTIQRNLEEEWKIKKDEAQFVTQAAWISRFMDCGDDELEHAAFLALWLSYFVFPSCYYHISDAILPIAVHLSSGTRIALAPAVLAHLYSELSLLKTHIRDFNKSRFGIDLSALFKLVHVWTWERFKELQPTPVPLLNDDQPRLDRWHDVKQRSRDVKQILEKSKIESFEWRPYTIAVRKWKYPKFYPEMAMQIPVGPDRDDEFVSYSRCIKVSELVGIDCVEHYFPNRVASQFAMLQDVPAPVNRNSLSQEEAWNDYNKPIEDLTLYIPCRSAIPCVTPMFCEWWRKTFPQLQSPSKDNQSAETLKSRHNIGDDPPSGSKVKRRSEDKMKIAESSADKKHKLVMKEARDRRREYMMKRARENNESTTIGRCETHVPLENNDSSHFQKLALIDKRHHHLKQARDKRRKHLKHVREKRAMYYVKKQARENDDTSQTHVPLDNDDEYGSLTIAQRVRLIKKKNHGGDASELFGKTSRLEADNNDPSPLKKLSSLGATGYEALSPPEIEERNEVTDENGSKTWEDMVLSPFDENYSTDAPLGANGGGLDIGVSPTEARQTAFWFSIF